jgi:Sulfotransferase domain
VIRYLGSGVKHAFGLHRPGRKLPVRPDDVLLASYPRSGNTWLRCLIANLIHPDRDVNFGNLHRLIVDPDISVKRDIDRVPQPRIVKTHGSFDPRYRRVICLVRDPRDVAVSQYRYLRQLGIVGPTTSIEDFIDRFLTGELNRHLGSWGENVGSWLGTRSNHSGLLLLKYEDMLADTAHELARAADFGGWPASPEGIARAVTRSTADKVRGCKTKQGESYVPTQAGKSRWQNDMPESQIARIEAAWGDVMACLGYDLASRERGSAFKSSLLGVLAAGAD